MAEHIAEDVRPLSAKAGRRIIVAPAEHRPNFFCGQKTAENLSENSPSVELLQKWAA